MLLCFGLIAILLCEADFACAENDAKEGSSITVCSQTYSEAPGMIEATSSRFHHQGDTQCEYVIRGPTDISVTLNFTRLYELRSEPAPNCLPEVRIAELRPSGHENPMEILCPARHNFHAPQVFHAQTHVLKVTYIWSPNQESGFSLYFSFHKAPNRSMSTVQIIIIVIAIILTLGLITCIISHYKMGARSWSERRSRPPTQPPSTGLHRQHCLQSNHHQQQHSHVITVPSSMYTPASVQKRQQLEIAAQRDRQIRLQSVEVDLALDLPSSVALPDGEEHPYSSMKSLHLRDSEKESEICRGCIRPPPNRTVLDGDTLPPYRSNSVGLLHKPSTSPCLMRTLDGTPLVMRSHSMSASSSHSGQLRQFAPHLQLPSLVISHNTSANSRLCDCTRAPASEFNQLDPPPCYSDVVGNRDLDSILNRPPDSGV